MLPLSNSSFQDHGSSHSPTRRHEAGSAVYPKYRS